MTVKVLVLAVALAACGADGSTTGRTTQPDAALPQWSCRVFVDCAGDAKTVETVVEAATEADAETPLVDECEQTTCSGALACHAVCEMP